MTMPALPANGDTSWGTGDWAEAVHNAAVEVVSGRLEATALAETIRDTAGTAITAGTGITKTVNDAGDTITIALSGVGVRSTKTGSTYTFVAGDANTIVEGNSASAQTFTVPNSVFAAEQSIVVRQYGAGQITIAAGSGTTARSRGAALKTAGQYAEAVITFRSASEFVVSGDITT